MRVFVPLRPPRAAVRWLLLMLLPLLPAVVSPLLMPYGVLTIYYLMPCAVCVAAVSGGLLAALIGVLSSVLSLHLCFGLTGALLGCAYLVPVLTAFLIVFARRVPFVRAAAVCAGALMLSQLAIFFLLQSMTGGGMYAAAGEAVKNYVAGMDECDDILITLYQSGLIGASSEMTGDMLIEKIGGYALTSAARNDFLLSLANFSSNLLSAFVPGAIVSQSVYAGVGAVALSVRIGRVQAQREAFRREEEAAEFPDLGMPPFAKWHLPRGWGLKVGVLASGYLLSVMSRNKALMLAGTLMYAAFSSVYAIQGAALVNFTQHKRDSKLGWRIAAPILLFLFVNQALVILGVVDQISGARGLRPPLSRNQGKEDDLQ